MLLIKVITTILSVIIIDYETFIMATQQCDQLVKVSQSQVSHAEAGWVAIDDEHIDQYQKDLERYEDMDDDDFKYENLLEGVPREATLDGGVQSKRFTDPVSEKDVLEKIKSTVPQSTK